MAGGTIQAITGIRAEGSLDNRDWAPSCCWATATAVFLQNTAWHLEHGAAKHQFSGAQSLVQVCEFSWTRGWLRPQRRELYGCTCTELGPKTYVRCGPECTREHECKDSSDTCYVRDSAESMNSMTAEIENERRRRRPNERQDQKLPGIHGAESRAPALKTLSE
ncbi:uncharacterized protein AAEQ78_001764 isoform 6-T13 [Lycaon pictus]